MTIQLIDHPKILASRDALLAFMEAHPEIIALPFRCKLVAGRLKTMTEIMVDAPFVRVTNGWIREIAQVMKDGGKFKPESYRKTNI